ncbi:hypothetical protein RJ640_015709 [Escallonia rubra]|uniref:protein-disulfide reductase n=1 Tax=Escallonia rubra TaxID=112253 RepID=A0AA88RFP2_9ASTE|nr:hypothetical protein RJ640_015709 [Escallonia rubra]
MLGPDYQSKSSDFEAILAAEGVGYLLSGEEKVASLIPWDPLTFSLFTCDGSTICLLLSANWCRPCRTFTPQLVQLYNTVRKSVGEEKLEIILVSMDRDETEFRQHYMCMPWLAVPFDVKLQQRLSKLYHVRHLPSLITLGVSGTLNQEDAVGLIQEYGADAFPFTKKRKEELKAADEAKRQGGKLDELLARGGRDYLVSGIGKEVWISELVGKTIGLYFGGNWCPPCHKFVEQLKEAYHELISTTNQSFEVVFVSTDKGEEDFNRHISNMPWLAIPYKDTTRQDICRIFDIKRIPALVLIAPNGSTISTNGRAMISLYGAMAYPFTESRIEEVEALLRKQGDGLPQQVSNPKHEHVLNLVMAKAYVCDFCQKHGRFWSFSCDVCDYDLHPTCVDRTAGA